MPSFPLHGAQKVENAGAQTSVSRGATVTASGANTKGSYTELIASTAFQASWIWIMLDDCAAGTDYLIDVAIGSAGSETIILPNLYVGGGTGALVYGTSYMFPIQIPTGSRIAARCQSSTAASVRVSALLFSGDFEAGSTLQKVSVMGENTADSGGTSVDPGAVANTKGSYSQIIASTARHFKYLIIAFGNQVNVVRSTQSWLVDIAIGAAASERIILPNIALNCSTSPDIVVPQCTPPLPVNIPSGTRIAVRAQSDGVDATDRLFDILIYGVS